MDKIEIAVIPKTVVIENSTVLRRTNNELSGIRLRMDDLYSIKGSYQGETDTISDTPVIEILMYSSKSYITAELTEENVLEMLDYIRKVKQQIGKQVNYAHSFQK